MQGDSLAGLKVVLQQQLEREPRGRQRDIARALGIGESQLSEFKRDGRKMSEDKLLALARHYGISVTIRWESNSTSDDAATPVVQNATATVLNKKKGDAGSASQLTACTLQYHDEAYRFARDEILRIIKELGLVTERFTRIHLGREVPQTTTPRPNSGRNSRVADRKSARRLR